jgi:estrone sulfotransferase
LKFFKLYKKLKRIFENDLVDTEITSRETDVYLVSYPKSGNTWMRFLLINYLFNTNRKPLLYSDLEKYIPSIHNSSFSKINSFKGFRIIKSHFVKKEYPKIIYIVRDGRDTMVSYYYYLKDLKDYTGSFEDFYYKKPNSELGSWDGHVRKALDYEKCFPENIIIIKYEDLKNDPHWVFGKVIEFLNYNIDVDNLNFAISNSTFERLKTMQESEGVIIENKNINFFRKGESQVWKDYFNHDLNLEFIEKSIDLIDKFGYKINN